jgi:glycosyltransferase involved in cell wall biosynthesis
MNPLISIVIPVYNREKLIVETVQSAQNQDHPNFEIVVVDNKSTDNTWQVLQEMASNDGRLKVFQNEENLGPVRNWERCFANAKGEYIKILWSDDLIKPSFLSEALSIFDEDTAFVMSGIEYFDINNTVVSHSDFQKNTQLLSYDYIVDMIMEDKKMGFPVSPGCGMFRRSDMVKNLIIEIPNDKGLIFNRFGAGNDLLLFLLTAKDYEYVRCVDDTLSRFRHHDDSITTSNGDRLIPFYEEARLYFIKNTDYKFLENTYKFRILKRKIKFGFLKFFKFK